MLKTMKHYAAFLLAVAGRSVETKALNLSNSNKTLNATWKENEEVKVYNTSRGDVLLGTLTAQSGGGDGTAIGHGGGSTVNGTHGFASSLTVKAGSSSSSTSTYTGDARASACHNNRYALIEP